MLPGAWRRASIASTTACAPNSWLNSVISSGRRTAAVLTETLSAPDMQNAARIGHRADAAAHRQRDEHLPRGARDHVRHDFARVARGRDIEEHQLVGAFAVVAVGQFHRIARIAQVDEVDAFDHAAAGDVETGNDAFRPALTVSTKLRTIFNPDRPGLFGMELHAEHVARFEHRRVRQRRKCRSPPSRAIHRHVVAVREIDERPAGQIPQQPRPGFTSSSFQPMCGTRASAGKRRTAPGNSPRPRASGRFFARSRTAPADPRQIPRNGTPARIRSTSASRTSNSSSARIIWPKWPTPGSMILSARRSPSRVAHQRVGAAQFRQRVLDRPQVAGAVIENRDHENSVAQAVMPAVPAFVPAFPGRSTQQRNVEMTLDTAGSIACSTARFIAAPWWKATGPSTARPWSRRTSSRARST